MPDVRLKHGIWVVVADGENALFLKNAGDATYPNFSVVKEMHGRNPATREQGTDQPGRYNDGPSVHRSAVEEVDWHRVSKERFADDVARHLYKMAHRGDFEEIILVAPPLVLGEMRKKLHKEVESKIVAEVAKTLTNHSIPDIEKILMAA
jgi:protein required for attachment to host cells